MLRLAVAGTLLGASLVVFSGLSFAHGGTYRGPGDTVPPGSGGPGTGGPKPGGPSSPGPSGPGGPSTPGPSGPATPPPGGTPTPQGPGGPFTGGLQGPDLSAWTFWWGFNREKYLQLKAQIAKVEGVITGGVDDDLLRGGSGSAGRESMRPSADQITRLAIPALKEALEKETNRDIVTGAMIALAKIGSDAQQSIEIFKKFMKSGDQEVAETAVLVLGIMAAPEGVPILIDFYEDTEKARQICGQREVPPRSRTFAAYGLGLTGARNADVRDKVQSTLLKFLEGEGAKRAAQKDLRVGTVISLGLIPDPERKAVAALQKYFDENRKREDVICAHVPNAIARLLAKEPANERGAYVQALTAELAGKGSAQEKFIRQSMAQAIGMLTTAEDPFAKKAVEVLQDKIDNELSKNNLLAYFGMIALGQIAGTDAPGNAIEKYLLTKAQAQGGKVMTRAWGALSLGVMGFAQANRKENQAKPSDGIGEALVAMMRDIKDPEQLSAYAVGIGLLRYQPGAEQLKKCFFESVKDDTYRGYFATGLGLMGDKDKGTLEKIKDVVKNATRRPELLRECAISLGLLGDKDVVPTLMNILGSKESNTLAVQAAVATALGFVGDYRAIESKDPKDTTLPSMLRDEKKELSAESRAFAAVAIGLVCDKEDLPWNFKISTDLNYTAAVDTLNNQSLQTGILNLL